VSIAVVITADDFGYCDAVDAGIATLVQQGRVTATSCLTSSPRWSSAAAVARGLHDQADLGLHLDLTEFARLASLPRLIADATLGRLDPSTLRTQIRSQLGAFEDAIGAPPDYIDGHQHVHQLRPVARVLIDEVLARYGRAGETRPWVRVSRPVAAGLKGRIIGGLGADSLERQLDAAGLRHTSRLLGVYDFSDAPSYESRLVAWLRMARDGDALMVHPASALDAADELGAARLREYTTLTSSATGALLAELGIRPVRGDTLHARRPA
jgi:predicted glycoside hydrolase/deacetylase ChbG (UPF0249 family)